LAREDITMALITWNDSFSVNVKLFDEQHRKLIEMLNDLHDAMKVGKGKEALEKVLKGLIQYTSMHFSNEEKLMKQYNYPEFEKHKKEHNQLVLQVLDVQKKHQEGNAILSQDVMNFLKNWLRNHIQGEDKNYGPFFNSKGLK
jgi:hemerythrin